MGRLGGLLGCLGALLGRFEALLGASWAVLGRSLGPLGPSWSVGKPNRREHEKPSKTYGKLINVDSWGSPGEPLGGLLDRLGGSLGVLGRSFGDSTPSWIILWTILGPSVPPGSASAELVQRGAVFRRLPPAFRPWPGPCPGGSPPDPPRGTLNGNPSARSGKKLIIIIILLFLFLLFLLLRGGGI